MNHRTGIKVRSICIAHSNIITNNFEIHQSIDKYHISRPTGFTARIVARSKATNTQVCSPKLVPLYHLAFLTTVCSHVVASKSLHESVHSAWLIHNVGVRDFERGREPQGDLSCLARDRPVGLIVNPIQLQV